MTLSLKSDLVFNDFERLSVYFLTLDELRNTSVLLTGGTGFFGKWLLSLFDYLNKNSFNIHVTVVSRSPERFILSEPSYRNLNWLSFIEADTQSVKVSGDFDYIIHAATDTSPSAHSDGLALFNSILSGGRNILDISAEHQVKRVLFIGSGAQYGTQAAGVDYLAEDSKYACISNSPVSAYGEAKRTLETMATLYAEKNKFEIVFARCFAFAGPGLALDHHFAIGNFIRDALFKSQIEVKSKGQIFRSYLYGADLAIWLITLLLRGENKRAYNVGSDQGIIISDLAVLVRDILSPNKEVVFLSQEGSNITSKYIPSIESAKLLGLDVWTDLQDSIYKMAEWNKHY